MVSEWCLYCLQLVPTLAGGSRARCHGGPDRLDMGAPARLMGGARLGSFHLGLVAGRQEPFAFAANDLVALANFIFQAGAVNQLDAATAVMDKAGALQLSSGGGNPFAANAEQGANILVRDVQRVGDGTIAGK